MKYTLSLIIAALILAGCGNREEEMQGRIGQLEAAADSLNKVIYQRDGYFEEVVRAINDVYMSIEDVRQQEASIQQQTGEAEGKFGLTNEQARANLLQQIANIDSTLVENRKKINGLRSRVRSLNKDFKALDETITNLKKMLEERELTIAMLEGKVTGLEADLVQKSREIAARDSVIESQVHLMNKVYYVAGTRDELEEKGIIKDEGGFPFGWFGSTTVLASGLDDGYFTPFDVANESVITIDGMVDEIVPQRSLNYYALNVVGEEVTDLNITDPARFWQDRYLVIITE
jgi:hypothetical protein